MYILVCYVSVKPTYRPGIETSFATGLVFPTRTDCLSEVMYRMGKEARRLDTFLPRNSSRDPSNPSIKGIYTSPLILDSPNTHRDIPSTL